MGDKYIWQHGNIEVVHEQGGQLVDNPVLLLNHLEKTIADRDAEIERLKSTLIYSTVDAMAKAHEKREAAYLAFVGAFDSSDYSWEDVIQAREQLRGVIDANT